MAEHRIARLIGATAAGPLTRILEFALAEGGIDFLGGQYVIVNTGIALAGNKTAKRAYSIVSSDREQRRFRIAVRRIGDGPGSNFMHRLALGVELPFSGPWGKFRPDGEAPARTLVLATDTGITAALGLVSGAAFEKRAATARVVWFVESEGYFLPQGWVRERVGAFGASLEIVAAPPVGHPERPTLAVDVALRALAEGGFESAFLSGDGAVLHPLRQALSHVGGLSPERVRIECFFNNPERKAGA